MENALMRRCTSEIDLRNMEGRCHGSSLFADSCLSRPSTSAPSELCSINPHVPGFSSGTLTSPSSSDKPASPNVATSVESSSSQQQGSKLTHLDIPGQSQATACLFGQGPLREQATDPGGRAARSSTRGTGAPGPHSGCMAVQEAGVPPGRPSPPMGGVACGMDPALEGLDPTRSGGQCDMRVHRGSSALQQLLKASGTTNVCH